MTFSTSATNPVIEVLNYLCEKFGIVIDWTADNVMPKIEDLCSRIVKYEFWTSVAWIAIVLLIIGILGIITAITSYKEKHLNYYDSDIPLVCKVILGSVSAIGLVIIGVQIFDMIRCITIPEKVIFDIIKTVKTNL